MFNPFVLNSLPSDSKTEDHQLRRIAAGLIMDHKTVDSAEGLSEETRRDLKQLFFDMAGSNGVDNVVNIDSQKTSASAELVQGLDLAAQYTDRILSLVHFGFMDDKGNTLQDGAALPSIEKVLGSFTQAELAAAARFQKPTLLLIPESGFGLKVLAVDCHPFFHQRKTYLHKTFQDPTYLSTLDGQTLVTGWRAAIAEGAGEMESAEWDDPHAALSKRLQIRKQLAGPTVHGMDRHTYIMLMMESIRNMDPIDRKTGTVLDGDLALSPSNTPAAGWFTDGRMVGFNLYSAKAIMGYMRFRSAVGGKKLIQ